MAPRGATYAECLFSEKVVVVLDTRKWHACCLF